MKSFLLVLITLLTSFSFGQGIVTPEDKPKEGPKPPVCRDPRFRMVADCESLVYVDKVNINGEDKDVVYNRKTQAVYSGRCKVCHNNGNLWMLLEYKNGWSYGVDTVYYENGNINLVRSHDTTGQGKEDGTWKFFREDGTLKWEKTFVMGAADGEQRYYFPDSTIEKIEMWKMGQLNGKKQEFYPGGTIKKEIGYKNGKFDGTYVTYFKDGKVESEQQYVNDKKTGPSSYYYDTGELFYTEFHENGLREGEFKRFYMDGKNGRLKITKATCVTVFLKSIIRMTKTP
ncbi:MAG: toxin-antitoxin system YwqK family antitoxin [Crocinitomicaceae bacterium]|nr:toxin-antitoxin system YwqK family antitoxin [Crocinitomicaceae bacterium]